MTTHVFEIRENERLLDVKTHGDNILCILLRKLDRLLHGKLVLEQEFLIICQHDDQGYIEDILQPFCELEGDGVSNVHAITAGPSPRVKK